MDVEFKIFNTSDIAYLFERAVGCTLVRCHGIGKTDPCGDELMLSAGRQVKRRRQVVLIVQVGTFGRGRTVQAALCTWKAELYLFILQAVMYCRVQQK
jgi:hypothetical protein